MSDDEKTVAEASSGNAESESKWLTFDGPKPGVSYPLKVIYCDGKYAVVNLLTAVIKWDITSH